MINEHGPVPFSDDTYLFAYRHESVHYQDSSAMWGKDTWTKDFGTVC